MYIQYNKGGSPSLLLLISRLTNLLKCRSREKAAFINIRIVQSYLSHEERWKFVYWREIGMSWLYAMVIPRVNMWVVLRSVLSEMADKCGNGRINTQNLGYVEVAALQWTLDLMLLSPTTTI